MGVDRDAFVRLGHHPVVDHDRFHMPVAAIRLSARVNAVSRPHGEESRRIWSPLWPNRDVARVPIGHVTNGVHVATWMANRILTLFDSHFGPDWLAQVDDPRFWDKVLDADVAEQLYRLLEGEVVPLFYDRDSQGVPRGWVEKMRHALRTAGARFTAQRMVRQYVSEYYLPAMRGDQPADDPPTA